MKAWEEYKVSLQEWVELLPDPRKLVAAFVGALLGRVVGYVGSKLGGLMGKAKK